MKFMRCEWTFRNLKGWSPQRIAAARRAVEREAARVAALRDQVALFPELQSGILPDFETVEERQDMMDAREIRITTVFRANYSAAWRQARAAFYRIRPSRRRGMRRLWNRSSVPKGPHNFAEFVRTYSRPGSSPWTYLRKLRLIHLWNHGGIPKPPHFREITANFATLGPVPHLRVLTQTLISLAALRGQNFRDLRNSRLRSA